MLAPLVLFVYNRPHHTKVTLEKLNSSPLAKKTNLYIFSDYPKRETDITNVQLTRDYIDHFKLSNNFKNITIFESIVNKGLAKSIIEGVTSIIKKYGKVIVIEDDILTSDDFLSYMNEGLNYYQSNKKIWSISGYTFPMKSLQNYNKDIYLSYRGSSWGWATWEDRWKSIDWGVSDYHQFKFNYKKRNKFNYGGHDLSDMLDMQMRREIDSWAIRWCYQQSKNNMFTIYPKISRVKNIGTDGSGTHSKNNDKFETELYKGNGICKFEEINIDKKIIKEFQNKYSDNYNFLRRSKSELKSIILRLIN